MVKDGSRIERELERRLWNEGWATFRVAGSGTVGHASADLVAVKDGKTLIMEVKSLKPESLPYNVRGDSEQLDTIVGRAYSGQINAVKAGFAIDIVGLDLWRWSDWCVSYIQEPENLQPLYKVLEGS